MPISPSKSRDLADENNKILTEWKWFETTVIILHYYMYLIYPRSFVLTKKQLYSQAPFTMPDNHSIYEAGYIPCTYAILYDKSTIFWSLCYDIHVPCVNSVVSLHYTAITWYLCILSKLKERKKSVQFFLNFTHLEYAAVCIWFL